MKINLMSVVLLGGGIILLYSGIKGYDPRDVIRWGLGGKKPKKLGSDGESVEPQVPPEQTPDHLLPDPEDQHNVPT